MKTKIFTIFLLIFAFSVAVFAQPYKLTPEFLGNRTTAPVMCSSSLFTIYYNQTSTKPFYCKSTNTWVELGGLSIGGTITGATATRIPFFDAGGVLAQDADLTWDKTNNRLSAYQIQTYYGLQARTNGMPVLESGFNSLGTVIFSYNATTPGLQIRTVASQTANTLELFAPDNTTKVFQVDPAGNFQATGLWKMGFSNTYLTASVGYGFLVNDYYDTINLFKVFPNQTGAEIFGSGAALYLTSPNGTRYAVTVSNAGALTVTAAP